MSYRMADSVDSSAGAYAPDDAQAVTLALLVERAGVVLGGYTSPAARSSAGAGVLPGTPLEDLLTSPDGAVFADWWGALLAACAKAASPDGAETAGSRLALFRTEAGQIIPVMVSVACITGRDEFIVSGSVVSARRLRLLNALHSIGLAISRLDLDRVLSTVRERVFSLMGADGFYIALYDAEMDLIQLREVLDDGQLVPQEAVPASWSADGLVGWVLRQRKPLLVGDSQRDLLPEGITVQVHGSVMRSVLLVPLLVQEQCVGALSVQSCLPNVYTDDDLWLLEGIAGQTAVAIHNAQLYEQTVNRLAALAALQRTALDLASTLDRETIVRVVREAVHSLLKPENVLVYLHSEHDGVLRRVDPPGNGDAQPVVMPRRAPARLANLIDEHGAPFILENTVDHADLLRDFEPQPASVVGFPIRRGGHRYGVLLLFYNQPRHFSQDDRRILSLMTNQAAVAVENAQYHADLIHRFGEVSALYALAQQMTGPASSDRILKMAVRTLRDMFQCRACVIALLEPGTQEIVIRAAQGVKQEWIERVRFRVGEGVAGRVVATGAPVYVPDVATTPAMIVFDQQVRSLLAVPVAYQNHVIGSLNLDSTEPDAFTPEHERILTIAAAQIAAVLENVRLLDEEAARAQKLAEANEALQMQDRQREEMLQNLSHELRNPLTYIKSYVTLLRDGTLGDVSETQLDALQIVGEKAESIDRLIGDVLLLEQVTSETLELTPQDINTLVAQAILSARFIHQERGLRFEEELYPGQAWVTGDRTRLNQVLDNLIGNAVKFTPAGGTITVRTRCLPDAQQVEVTVIDTGIGIAPEYRTRIFERFFQVPDPQRGPSGSGIGLAIVRRVLEAHGGRIWVDSTEGQGSAFTFTLPLVERRAFHEAE